MVIEGGVCYKITTCTMPALGGEWEGGEMLQECGHVLTFNPLLVNKDSPLMFCQLVIID